MTIVDSEGKDRQQTTWHLIHSQDARVRDTDHPIAPVGRELIDNTNG